ncbi:hypothetical protein SAMN04488168_10947 [Bacillus sp. 491mf]|nr:hypothetical protein SAMN04488168_10947 [Bacillus sp. 491mf]
MITIFYKKQLLKIKVSYRFDQSSFKTIAFYMQ